MKYPKRIELATSAVINLTRAVAEDPFTEPFLELYGRKENNAVRIFNVYNFATADRAAEEVGYGNFSAKERLEAFEEALAASNPHADISRRVGQAHAHLHPNYGELNREDLTSIQERMKEYEMDTWIEIILHHRPMHHRNLGLGVYYSRDGKRAKVTVSNPGKKINKTRGFRIEIDFVGHFVYATDRLIMSKELYVFFDDKIRKYFTSLPSRS